MAESTQQAFALRTPFERRYAAGLSKRAHPDAVRAFNATPPVRRKYFSGAAGLYRPGHHYVVAPPRWEHTPEGALWLGVFAHEMGHAVDMHGRGAAGGRSVWLAPAIRHDRARMAGHDPRGQNGWQAGALARFPPAARDLLARAFPDADAADFACRWHGGAMREALLIFVRRLVAAEGEAVDGGLPANGRGARRRGRPADARRLLAYALASIDDFLAAVYDLDGAAPTTGADGLRASRRSAYFRSFPALAGPSLTAGHAAEAFANAFAADVLEGTELLSYLTRTAAPSTHAAYRAVLAQIGGGSSGGEISPGSSSR